MSIRSMFIFITALAFSLTACIHWNVRDDLDVINPDLLMAFLVLFEAVWFCVNFLGVRECKRIAAGPHDNGAATALHMGFVLIIMFQILFFFRVLVEMGAGA